MVVCGVDDELLEGSGCCFGWFDVEDAICENRKSKSEK